MKSSASSRSRRPLSTLPLTVACCAFFTVGLVRAETIQFPKDAPVASFELPSGWTAGARKDGTFACLSGDHKILLIFKPARGDADDETAAAAEATAFAKSWNISDTTPDSDNGPLGKMYRYRLNGKMNGVQTAAFVLLVSLSPGNKCFVESPAATADMDSHAQELEGLIRSIKAVGASPSPVAAAPTGFDSLDATAPGANAAAAVPQSGPRTISYPTDGSGVSFTLPPGWTTSTSTNGDFNCSDPRREITLVFVKSSKDIPDIAAAVEARLKEINDLAPLKEASHGSDGSKGNSHGVTTYSSYISGKFLGQAWINVVAGFTSAQKASCLLYISNNREALRKHRNETDAIMESMQPGSVVK